MTIMFFQNIVLSFTKEGLHLLQIFFPFSVIVSAVIVFFPFYMPENIVQFISCGKCLKV